MSFQTIKEPEGDEHTIVTVENPAAVSTEDTNMIYENKVIMLKLCKSCTADCPHIFFFR